MSIKTFSHQELYLKSVASVIETITAFKDQCSVLEKITHSNVKFRKLLSQEAEIGNVMFFFCFSLHDHMQCFYEYHTCLIYFINLILSYISEYDNQRSDTSQQTSFDKEKLLTYVSAGIESFYKGIINLRAIIKTNNRKI